jgi:hypothetical protein
MLPRALAKIALPALLVVLLSAGCGEEEMQGPSQDDPVPDFSLLDVNDTSPRSGETVSPRDYAGQVSAWYFGHAT